MRPKGSGVADVSCVPGEEAAFEPARDLLLIELAADEDEPVHPLLVCAPRASRLALELHLHALEQELIRVAAQIEDALHPQDVGAEFRDQRAEPQAELHAVERAGLHDAHGLDVAEVIVMMVVVMIAVVVMMIVMGGVRVDLMREIGAPQIEHRGQVQL